MKRLVFLVVMILMAVPVLSNDITVNYRDSISAADTTGAGTQRFDTTYGEWKKIHGAEKFHFYAKIEALNGVIDTNFANDSFFIDVELTFDKVGGDVTKLFQLDTLLDTDSAWTGNDALSADSLRGNYLRVRFIHHAPKAPVAAFENIYGKRLNLWYVLIKER